MTLYRKQRYVPIRMCCTRWTVTNGHFLFFMQIAEFRKGDYHSKDESVKKAWLFCMMELMCYVTAEWGRVGVQRTKRLWERTSPSDEALVSWYLICYAEEWTKEVENENAHMTENTGKLPRRYKRGVEHYSRTKLFRFVELEKRIQSSRRETKDWDEAIRNEADRLYREKTPQTNHGGGVMEAVTTEEAFDLPSLKMSGYIVNFDTATI